MQLWDGSDSGNLISMSNCYLHAVDMQKLRTLMTKKRLILIVNDKQYYEYDVWKIFGFRVQ